MQVASQQPFWLGGVRWGGRGCDIVALHSAPDRCRGGDRTRGSLRRAELTTCTRRIVAASTVRCANNGRIGRLCRRIPGLGPANFRSWRRADQQQGPRRTKTRQANKSSAILAWSLGTTFQGT